jgi:hypothetical protein
MDGIRTAPHRGVWNKGKLVGQKAPFKLQEIWAIRVRLQMQGRPREVVCVKLCRNDVVVLGDEGFGVRAAEGVARSGPDPVADSSG